jgi:hypothetical protein
MKTRETEKERLSGKMENNIEGSGVMGSSMA